MAFFRLLKGLAAGILLCTLSFAAFAAAVGDDALLSHLKLPEGFSISVYARGINGVRMIEVTPLSDLIVSVPGAGQVLLIKRGGDARPVTLLDHLKLPQGIALHDGWLYVAETNAVGRVRFDPLRSVLTGEYQRIIKDIPGGGRHFTRSLKFGPDGYLYLTIGSSCDACVEKDQRRAAMLRFKADGSAAEIYATGLRNSVGFDWNPVDGKLYATEAGRDFQGDDIPPDELNQIEKGGFYGWPYAYGQKIPDPTLVKGALGRGHAADIARSIAPVHAFGAHVTPLGMAFIRGEELPYAYRNIALVALHGSWNRSKKVGYKLVSLIWGADGKMTEQDFLTGFLVGENVLGRPVDVAEGPDGAIYVSDDAGGRIFRITYHQAQPNYAELRPLRTQRVNW
jgi:glucose/arabinose dehydrogenase